MKKLLLLFVACFLLMGCVSSPQSVSVSNDSSGSSSVSGQVDDQVPDVGALGDISITLKRNPAFVDQPNEPWPYEQEINFTGKLKPVKFNPDESKLGTFDENGQLIAVGPTLVGKYEIVDAEVSWAINDLLRVNSEYWGAYELSENRKQVPSGQYCKFTTYMQGMGANWSLSSLSNVFVNNAPKRYTKLVKPVLAVFSDGDYSMVGDFLVPIIETSNGTCIKYGAGAQPVGNPQYLEVLSRNNTIRYSIKASGSLASNSSIVDSLETPVMGVVSGTGDLLALSNPYIISAAIRDENHLPKLPWVVDVNARLLPN